MNPINNDHNVYVIGAGFSAARGLPLMNNFMFALRDAHEWLQDHGRLDEARSVEKVLEFRLKSTSAAYRVRIDLENIEELFSLASAVDESLTRDICISIAATIDFCAAQSVAPKTRFNLGKGGPDLPGCLKENVVHQGAAPNMVQYEAATYDFVVAGLLGQLDAPVSRATHALISFNYDLLVEQALTRLGLPFSYGFASHSVIEGESSRSLAISRADGVPLLKLHGSTNWAYPGRRGGRLTIFGSYDEVRQAGYTPALVPPTWRKTFDGALTYVWQEALLQISRATRLIVIGFSMPPTDLHFKYLLAAGLRENISLREILFVNPDAAGVEKRAHELFGELGRRPSIRTVENQACNFVAQGELPTTTHSIARRISADIQHIYHSC